LGGSFEQFFSGFLPYIRALREGKTETEANRFSINLKPTDGRFLNRLVFGFPDSHRILAILLIRSAQLKKINYMRGQNAPNPTFWAYVFEILFSFNGQRTCNYTRGGGGG
jgi:hypothetical protein